MKTRSCETCGSHKVCFMQKQIEGLAERMTQSPFVEKVDTEAARTLDMVQRREKRMNKRYDLERELKGVIASSCSLFFLKGTE